MNKLLLGSCLLLSMATCTKDECKIKEYGIKRKKLYDFK